MGSECEMGRRRRSRNYYGAVLQALEPRILMDDSSGNDLGNSLDTGWSDVTTPVETQPADTQPADTQPADTQPSDTQPGTQGDTQPSDSGGDTGSTDNSGSDNSGLVDTSGANNCSDNYGDTSTAGCDQRQEVLYPPNRPTHLTVQAVSDTSLYLSWREGADEVNGFVVMRWDPASGLQTIATLGGGARHYTDTGLLPGTVYSYSVRAFNSAGYSDYSDSASLATPDTSASDPTFVGQFGQLPGGLASAPYTFNDADGTQVTLSLSGPGTGMLHLNADGYDLEVTGTTLGSALQISTVKTPTAGDDGRLELADLTVGDTGVASDHTAIGSVSAKTTDLSGNVTITGGVRSLTLGNLTGQDVVTIGGSLSSGVALNFGRVFDATVNSGLGIGSLTATSWGDGAIAAPYLGTLRITGRGGKVGAVAGDFGAELTLAGAAGRATTLGKVIVANRITGGTWQIAGGAGSIAAKSVANGWTLALSDTAAGAGNLANLTLSDKEATSTNVQISANAIGSINVQGSVGGSRVILREPDSAKHKSLGRLVIRGPVKELEVDRGEG